MANIITAIALVVRPATVTQCEANASARSCLGTQAHCETNPTHKSCAGTEALCVRAPATRGCPDLGRDARNGV